MFYLFYSIAKQGPNVANNDQGNTKSNPKCLAHHFPSNDALFKSKSYLKVQFYLFQGIWGISAIWSIRPKQGLMLQMMVRETQKVILTVQLIISHQMMPQANPKAMERSGFICFRVFRALAPFGETGPKYHPNTANHGQGNTKNKPKSSAYHFTLNDVLFKCKSHVKVRFYLFQGIWGISTIWGNWAQIVPKNCKLWLQRHKK